jgi:phosphopentomutase
MIKRVTLIVLDSLGVGELPDAVSYGDGGANTLGHIIKEYPEFNIPNLRNLGFGNIASVGMPVEAPAGAYGKLKELSKGKDTITGHWEIAGLRTDVPFKTYPEGFPQEFIEKFQEAIGREVLGNCTASGTVIIDELGTEHEATGKPIVYTSADSVFQIAVNIDVIPLEELYRICEVARGMLQGEWACGRVIARPYVMKDGKRERTSDRKDYAVSPPEKTMLDLVAETGKQVYAVGKISDIFNGQGVTTSVHTDNNMDGVDKTIEALKQDFEGLIFTNLVDFDSKFGHRRDAVGYGKAIEEFDSRLPEIIAAMKDTDTLILCADHGNDPVHSGWDHTREHVPVVIYGADVKSVDMGVRESFADIGATICEILGAEKTAVGESFMKIITGVENV